MWVPPHYVSATERHAERKLEHRNRGLNFTVPYLEIDAELVLGTSWKSQLFTGPSSASDDASSSRYGTVKFKPLVSMFQLSFSVTLRDADILRRDPHYVGKA